MAPLVVFCSSHSNYNYQPIIRNVALHYLQQCPFKCKIKWSWACNTPIITMNETHKILQQRWSEIQNQHQKLTIIMAIIIDLIRVLKTVMHYGNSGISRETNLLSEKIDLYISQKSFLCSLSDTIHNASQFSKLR